MTQQKEPGAPMSENQLSETPWLDPDAQPIVKISKLTKQYDDAIAVDDVDLNIYAGELFAILGGSGSGKTTLLRMLAGFERPTSGQILIDGVDMTSVAPYERPVNMMFQSYALFPHMSVEQNVAYGLKKDRVAADQIKIRVREMLDMVKLGALAKRKPRRLSGGERQRVALARALIKRPKLLLLDEPLAALDKKLREHTQFELMNLQDDLGITFIVVTHDQEEAMTLSTRIAVMNQGRFEQVGTPGEVYEYPANRFIADFVGNINLLEATVVDSDSSRVRLHCAQIQTELFADCHEQDITGGQHWVAVRPEKIFIDKEPPSAGDRTVLKGVVLDLGYFGNLSLYKIQLPSGLILQVSAQNRRRSAIRTVEWDDEVYISWDISSAILLTE
jgi:putrescine transport system ATP-binding protein